MVFYLKYRPQKIKELDSENVREKLIDVFSKQGSVPHAFLFTGPKGLGKTSAARIVAKVLNCERKLKVENGKLKIKNKNSQLSTLNSQPGDVEPCNKCLQCTSITNGTNMDVLEIDAASNRGIDEIRDLREKIRLLPFAASKKVYIIDEVHMLTTEAFNALLKTLEEPPPHAIFILCTTEPHKIPGTILSRCFHVSFKRAKSLELVRSFQRIAKDENLKIDKEGLLHIASLSDGSFRDGVKILEELSQSAGRKKITKELVDEKYKISNTSRQISKMIEYLGNKDTKSGLKLVGEMAEQGVDMKYFLEQTIEELHSQILKNIGIETESSSIDYRLDILKLKNLIELFSKAHSEIKYAVLPQLPLELAIIEYTNQSQNQEEENVGRLSHVANDAEGDVRLTHAARDARLTYQQNQPQPRSLSESRHQTKTKSKVKSQSTFSSLAGDQAHIPVSQRSIEDKIDLWQELILRVKPYNHSVAGVLRGCKLKSFDGKSLIIETGYKFHKERLEEKKTLEIIEKVCREITRKNVDVSITMKRPA